VTDRRHRSRPSRPADGQVEVLVGCLEDLVTADTSLDGRWVTWDRAHQALRALVAERDEARDLARLLGLGRGPVPPPRALA
jgi:hypothetical protein